MLIFNKSKFTHINKTFKNISHFDDSNVWHHLYERKIKAQIFVFEEEEDCSTVCNNKYNTTDSLKKELPGTNLIEHRDIAISRCAS